jgi:hypothetical protein
MPSVPPDTHIFDAVGDVSGKHEQDIVDHRFIAKEFSVPLYFERIGQKRYSDTGAVIELLGNFFHHSIESRNSEFIIFSRNTVVCNDTEV